MLYYIEGITFCILYIQKRLIPLTRFRLRTLTHVNFNHVNKIEARQKVLSLNEKLTGGAVI